MEGAIDGCMSVKKQKKRQNQYCWGLVLIVSMPTEYFTSINIDGLKIHTLVTTILPMYFFHRPIFTKVVSIQTQTPSFRSNVSLSALIFSDLASTGRERVQTCLGSLFLSKMSIYVDSFSSIKVSKEAGPRSFEKKGFLFLESGAPQL